MVKPGQYDPRHRSARPSSARASTQAQPRTRRPRGYALSGEDPSHRLPTVVPALLAFARYRLPYLVASVCLGWLLTQIMTLSDYRVTRIEVVGNSMVRAEEIAAASSAGAQNIFLLDRAALESSVLGLRPLRDVEARLVLPNRLVLNVAEREPAYVWRVEPKTFLVSRDGVVLSEVGKRETQGVTLVDLDQQPVRIGEEVDSRALETADFLMRALPDETGIQPTHFEYSRTYGVVLPTALGFRVAFGQSDDLSDKVSILRAVLDSASPDQAPINFIDLRFKDHPYLR